MKSIHLAPLAFVALVSAATGGCAQGSSEDAQSGNDAFTASTGVAAEVGGAIGAIVVNGEKLCTATLVNVSGAAQIQVNGAQVDASGRQVVFGGACVGKLSAAQKDFVGVAAFVSVQGGVSVSTPIVDFDFKSQASAGLAVGILGAKSQAAPLDFVGLTAGAHAGASAGALVHASDKSGLVVGAGFQFDGGFDVAFQSQCASFSAGVSVSGGASGSLQLRGGDDAAAIVRVNGKFAFAAHLDVQVNGQCVIDRALEDLDQFGEQASSAGVADIASMQYHPTGKGTARFSVFLDKPAATIRINTSGAVNGTSDGVKCHKLAITGAPCELFAPQGGEWTRGWHTIDVDIELSLFASPKKGQLVVFSTSDTAFGS